MIADINKIIHQQVDLQGPGVAIAVVKDGKPVHVAGYGLANVEWECSITSDTVFRLASVTKQFTATAIMLLEQEGKLSLDEPITTYLPDYPTHGQTITITHLLNHTSGIPSYTGLPNFFPDIAQKEMQAADLLPYFQDLPLDFEPGTRFLYNNSGYILLGLIIEKLSGMSYAEFIQQRIFQPLDMNRSYYMNTETVIPRRADGYDKIGNGYQHCIYLNMKLPHAAGSLGSTVEDLIRWDAALREERLLDLATQERMYTPTRLTNGQEEVYGFGWGVATYEGHRVIHHGGGIPGFHTFIARFVDDNAMVVVLGNSPQTNVEKIVRDIARLLFGLPAITHTPATLSSTTFDKAAGTYDLEAGVPVEVTHDKDALALRGVIEFDLLPLTETTYYAKDDNEVEIHFADEQDGTFNTISIQMPLHEPIKGHRKRSE